MKKLIALTAMITMLILAACGGDNGQEGTEEASEEKGEIVFGQTSWTSTEAPTQIAKQILEEVGYDVEITLLDQPVIWEGLENEEIHFFMDAWLPYTEAALWEDYQDTLQQVSTSYEEVPLGWVVPEYVDADTIGDLEGRADEFDGEIVTIGEGAGIVELTYDVMEEENYNLDGFEVTPTSEAAMLGVMNSKIDNEEPFIITGWRPHSMFAQHDLKFLEDTEGHFQYDNVYVLSYQGIEDQPEHQEAYDILSQWSIDVDDLEEMMYDYENNDVDFEDSAAEWIEENRDTVDEWIN
ncbi:glycine betaine/proline transport system substrate-binding protein [Alkalibacillus filiformis]|uniref:Glycine betaine/proline transport system substrate-binding protein n=1 Tax=Alkalibacillus filiformis TaxID=200990 RepID=A0ABU0DSN5_9BACI|nr:glycine betaine ABC transporter substrate-binding protein [Alkalibacillus filiformis]MDQ0351326.1 glycine betaine/proline transport system substrate-binding protein [Alkalibacillus filiformis]